MQLIRSDLQSVDGMRQIRLFLGAEYTDSVGGIGVSVFNSLDPLSQTFKVDANLFNDGLCLESVRLFLHQNHKILAVLSPCKSDLSMIMVLQKKLCCSFRRRL